MSTNTLNSRSNGETIDQTFFNDIHSSLEGDFVGRNTSGVPTASQNLGTTAIPWGTGRFDSLVVNGATIDTSLSARPQNTVTSGKMRSTSNQPAFITPNGAAATAIIAATTTPLVLDINGTAVTVSADITLTGLTTAPASNNTATVNDTSAASQESTRTWGEVDQIIKPASVTGIAISGITMTSAGTNITALIGKFASFKIVQGGNTEYFFAFVESATRLTKIYRGFFYNSSLAPINRIVFSNSAVITLMSTGWVFVENNATTTNVSYTVPTWSVTSPSGPATGDYWYDIANDLWKRYDGASFVTINRTLIGMVIMDSTNCVAARAWHFYKPYDSETSVKLEISTVAILRATRGYQTVSVNGKRIHFNKSLPTWNMTTDLATSADMYNATEQASTTYYFYVKDTGAVVISDISPFFRGDFRGYYHPHNPWRCVGFAGNSSGSDLTTVSDFSTLDPVKSEVQVFHGAGTQYGSTNTKIRRFLGTSVITGLGIQYSSDTALGDSFTINENGTYSMSWSDSFNAGNSYIGFSVNSTQLTTNIQTITNTDRLAVCITAATSVTTEVSASAYLKVGDVVRAHGDGASNETTITGMRITKMSR